MKKIKPTGEVRQQRVAWTFIAIPVTMLTIFSLLPIFISLAMSFTDYDVINKASFVGLANYRKLLGDPFFFKALQNTLYYTLLYVPGGLLVALGTAMFLNANHKLATVFRTFFYLPILCSTVATATLWFWILNPQHGLMNWLLGLFDIAGPAWLYDSGTLMPSIILMSIWARFGTNMMIFLAGLKGIPATMYEAARIEGAGRWQLFWHITRPALSRTTFLVSTLLIIDAMQVFDQAYVLTEGGGPGNAALTLVYYIYNNGFTNLRMGYASAISFVLFLFILAFSVANTLIGNREED